MKTKLKLRKKLKRVKITRNLSKAHGTRESL